jgi:hypothetical protein
VSAVTGEERGHGGDLLRPAKAAEGRQRLEAGEKLLTFAGAVGLGLGSAGLDALTVIPRGPNSLAITCVIASIAPFVAS